jgi:hypothetical protein
VEPTGHYCFISGIKIAHLCLKHRQGKKHNTRIVAFVDKKEMVKLEGTGSHLVTIPPARTSVTHSVSSPIVQVWKSDFLRQNRI